MNKRVGTMRCFLIFILLFFGFPNLSMGYFYDVPIWKQINKLTCTGGVRWDCANESCKKINTQALWEINFLENRIDHPTVTNKFVPKSVKIIEKFFYLMEGIDLSKHVILFESGRLMDFDIDDFVVNDRDTINAANDEKEKLKELKLIYVN